MFEADVLEISQEARTGELPPRARVADLLDTAYARYRDLDAGEVADYIPVLAEADPSRFGLTFSDLDGVAHSAGSNADQFSIQSISKAFVLALVHDAIGHERLHQIVGVNNSGLPFNSVIALELNDGDPMNPMVNAGALATTALMPGATPRDQWHSIQSGLSRFAGRPLTVDEDVYHSETRSNHRNRGLAHLLASYGRIISVPEEVTDLYTRQCALSVTVDDLAVMGATLAGGGVNPATGQRVVSAGACRDTLAVLTVCGMYERTGEWQFEIGMPAKSGVSGGLVAMAPGKGALGAFSPRLDPAGNSVRSQRACAHLSRSLGLNLFASLSRTSRKEIADE